MKLMKLLLDCTF